VVKPAVKVAVSQAGGIIPHKQLPHTSERQLGVKGVDEMSKYIMFVANGDGSTTSDTYIEERGEDLEALKTQAPKHNGDGWNRYCWIEDESGDEVWNRDFPV
jgi:hypothetical protein